MIYYRVFHIMIHNYRVFHSNDPVVISCQVQCMSRVRWISLSLEFSWHEVSLTSSVQLKYFLNSVKYFPHLQLLPRTRGARTVSSWLLWSSSSSLIPVSTISQAVSWWDFSHSLLSYIRERTFTCIFSHFTSFIWCFFITLFCLHLSQIVLTDAVSGVEFQLILNLIKAAMYLSTFSQFLIQNFALSQVIHRLKSEIEQVSKTWGLRLVKIL